MLRVGGGRGIFARATESEAAAPAISCAYPLDDDGTLATAFGYTLLPMDAPGYQTGTYTQTGVAAGLIALNSAAFTTGSFSRPASAPIAVQGKCTAADVATTGYVGGISLLLAVFDSGGSPVGNAVASIIEKYPLGAEYSLTVNGTTIASGALTGASAGKSVAFYVNADGTIGYTAGGVDRGAVTGLTVGATDTFIIGLFANDGASYEAAAAFSYQLITAAPDYTEPAPAGSTDLCGTAI